MQESTQATSQQTKYECEKCKDLGSLTGVDEDGIFFGKPCECSERRLYERILERSGMTEALRKKGFKNYATNLSERERAKDLAIKYTKGFAKERNSIAFLGQPGAGKTHLSIAIANNLMAQNIGVSYFPYREVVPRIKQVANNAEEYQRELNKYKNAKVLLIDDLYKFAIYRDSYGAERVNDADMRVMFEIINYRYLKQSPIIVSSEYSWEQIVEFDDATGSRIIEMCKPNIYTFKGEHLNYRIMG